MNAKIQPMPPFDAIEFPYRWAHAVYYASRDAYLVTHAIDTAEHFATRHMFEAIRDAGNIRIWGAA